MIGLMKKDFYNVGSSLKIYFLIPLLFAVLGYQDGSTDLLAFGTCFLGIFIVISSFAYDDMAHFNNFALTLPIDRKKYAAEKYVFGMLLGVCSLFLAIILAVILNLIEKSDTTSDILISAVMLLPFVFLLVSIMILFQLKFGSEKGRIAISAALGIVFLISFILGELAAILGINIAEVINRISLLGAGGLFIVIFVISMIVVLFSMKISISIMNKKEF